MLSRPSWFEVVTDPIRLRVLKALNDLGECTATELARAGYASDPALRRHLGALVSLGLVFEHRGESDGLTPGRPASRFSLAPEAKKTVSTLLTLLNQPAGPVWILRTPSPPLAR